MSDITVTVEKIESVEAHPNADKLEIAQVLGTQTVVLKGEFEADDLVVFFPPDICLPANVAERLGVAKYLKKGERVAATRLRGVPSYGFVQRLSCLPPDIWAVEGMDVTEAFGAWKYEPPVKVYRGGGGGTGEVWGGLAPEPYTFHRYTDIQHYWKYKKFLPAGTPVRITEKIHGTNSRVGLLKIDDEWQFLGGSHKTARKQIDPEGRESVYWYPLTLKPVLSLLTDLCDEQHDVILFGELFGPGVQDMDYGVEPGTIGWRLFDISVDGRYLDWDDLHDKCVVYGISTAPLLYRGPFDPEDVNRFTYGPTTVAYESDIKGKFKGREGIVITPLKEQPCALGRLILKSVSADYLDRKGAQDNGEA